MYVLIISDVKNKSQVPVGIFDARSKLREGVDYWMEQHPESILHYSFWFTNEYREAQSWEWAYIPIATDSSILAESGGSIPKPDFFGKNLISTEWESQEETDNH